MRTRLAALLAPVLLALAGCTAAGGEGATTRDGAAQGRPSPFQDCAGLTTPAGATPHGAVSESVPNAADPPAGGPPLPELTLTCFTGGAPIALRDVRGPAVINLWASWCAPCRTELPAFQRLSERAEGRLTVLGVNTRDTRSGAQSIGEDFGVRFPTLVDQGESLQRSLGRSAIPLTVLVDADGRVRHVDASGALDDARLAELVRRHLAVAVPQ
ncbi:TlpA disulfide reductase family protein [Micromonospora sp. WMMA1363]|uniref:TlpA family protein disulfide reductase n=1 Tax=Micromonospora sp. WMMA1363 TaxID=3053985 RepID=UPI00259CBE6A|nr:TlpA disulfide reductase family protein [Micromonospora sp. WMMA1363]MDM4721294.1 TlpA disulfide reductase family protein [Micromonospora sp. WMMA1363]